MRKSKQQRINEGNALIAAIKQDPILASEQGWLLRFLGDLVSKFSRGKGGTKRQRNLFDEKIADGVPARKVNNHIAQPIVGESVQLALDVRQINIFGLERVQYTVQRTWLVAVTRKLNQHSGSSTERAFVFLHSDGLRSTLK